MPVLRVLALDAKLSRELATEVAAAYRAPLSAQEEKAAPTLAGDRRLAAEALEQFAAGRCDVPQERRVPALVVR